MLINDDAELDQLLAGGQLSGAQYDAIEKRVLDRLQAKRISRWLFVAAPSLGAVAAAAVACLWIMGSPQAPPGEREALALREPAPGIRAKGDLLDDSAPATARVSITCEGRAAGSCRLGDTLLFSVEGAARSGYLGAFAQPESSNANHRIWYFPTLAGDCPEVPGRAGTRVLSRGVRLGAPHAPGRYEVTVWLSETPPARADAAHLSELATSTFSLEIVP